LLILHPGSKIFKLETNARTVIHFLFLSINTFNQVYGLIRRQIYSIRPPDAVSVSISLFIVQVLKSQAAKKEIRS